MAKRDNSSEEWDALSGLIGRDLPALPWAIYRVGPFNRLINRHSTVVPGSNFFWRSKISKSRRDLAVEAGGTTSLILGPMSMSGPRRRVAACRGGSAAAGAPAHSSLESYRVSLRLCCSLGGFWLNNNSGRWLPPFGGGGVGPGPYFF